MLIVTPNNPPKGKEEEPQYQHVWHGSARHSIYQPSSDVSERYHYLECIGAAKVRNCLFLESYSSLNPGCRLLIGRKHKVNRSRRKSRSKQICLISKAQLLIALPFLRYEDGKPANVSNGIYNHHVVFADTFKAPLALVACPGQKPKAGLPISIFVATGEEGNSYTYTADEAANFDGGYYIGKDHGISLFAEIVNCMSAQNVSEGEIADPNGQTQTIQRRYTAL
jgi:hypothetical protein